MVLRRLGQHFFGLGQGSIKFTFTSHLARLDNFGRWVSRVRRQRRLQRRLRRPGLPLLRPGRCQRGLETGIGSGVSQHHLAKLVGELFRLSLRHQGVGQQRQHLLLRRIELKCLT